MSGVCLHPSCRTIDKMGGLDNYIMQTPDAKLDSDKANELKLAMLLTTLRAQQGLRIEPAAAGESGAAAAAADAEVAPPPERPLA